MESLKDLIAKMPQAQTSLPPGSTLEEEWGCERCQDLGYVVRRNKGIPVGDPDYLAFTPCPDCRKPALQGIPVGKLNNTFQSFDLGLNPAMKPAYDRCKAVAEEREWCAFLVGSYGNGKTHLAIAALQARGTGRFWKVPDLLDWIRRTAYEEKLGIEAALRPYREGSWLLVLDDLGTENQTDWAGEQLYRILDSRYESHLPTIITANVQPKLLDGRIQSRYREGRVICAGTDLREKLAQQREGC